MSDHAHRRDASRSRGSSAASRSGRNTASYPGPCGGISPPTSPECNDGVLPGTFTSRLSVNTVSDVVDTFDEYKRWLVQEAGFGGTLNIPRQKKLNLKFSAWLMSIVDVRSNGD